MGSNYNSRTRAPEVLVDGERYCVVRQRESVADLLALESRLPD
jgi:diaminopimelate decarboxylase